MDDELKPIKEHDEYTASGNDQHHSPECDKTMSAEVCVYVCVHVCMRACMRACMHAFVHICVYVCDKQA